jgi:hypothetical protein
MRKIAKDMFYNPWGVKKDRALWGSVARSFGTGSRNRKG